MKSELPPLRARRAEAHKGDFGHVLVLAGSRGMAGAACLATLAALRSGAGLVTCATPASAQTVVAQRALAAMTLPLPEITPGELDGEAATEALEPLLARCDVLLAGPGLTTQEGVRTLLASVLRDETFAGKPVVLDADALNVLATLREQHAHLLPASRTSILTPHPKEFARLAACELDEVRNKPQERGMAFLSGKPGVTLVLKSHATWVLAESLPPWRTPLAPNAGLAKGGTGDVLAGLLAGLLAQGYRAGDAARLGVYLHGLAGTACRERLGPEAMTAADLLDHLATAFATHRTAE